MRSLSWRIALRVVAVLSWIVSILWLIIEPGFEPLLASLAGVATFLGSFVASDAPVTSALKYHPTPEQRQRNRRAMLQLVKNSWIKGVLEQSLYSAAMIELGLEERANLVERTWDIVLQIPGQPERPLPPGTNIGQVFDTNRALLILGGPGSGKTTTLLQLARDTIARAEEDATQPIPVVFNLSSWAERRQSISDWLVDELCVKYYIRKKIARGWIENDDLLLLLDGLDEVQLERRAACVKAINEFRYEHGLTSLVVCSRIADYEVLTAQLRFQGAVLLHPLSVEQVDQYLKGTGTELLAVRKTLEHDAALQELAQSPLMLSIMTVAYQGMSVEDLGSLDSIEARRRHVLDTYVRRMFERRRAKEEYPPELTTFWLVWLAQEMSRRTQTMFLIERLQPSWLQTDAQRRLFTIASILICGLIGVVAGLVTDDPIIGLIFGLGIGLLLGPGNIEMVEAVGWSWKEGGKGLVKGLIAGICYGLIVGLISGLIVRLIFGLLMGLSIGLAMGLIGGLIGGLFGGTTSAEVETRVVPNQGVVQSAGNAISIGLVYGLIAGLIGILVDRLIGEPVIGPAIGLLGGPMVWLSFGGFACIQHFILRFILYSNGRIPWNYARFLDYAAEHSFLRKVGGGYVFVHRLLMEHFAAWDKGQ